VPALHRTSDLCKALFFSRGVPAAEQEYGALSPVIVRLDPVFVLERGETNSGKGIFPDGYE
jgi:hypothetical protein